MPDSSKPPQNLSPDLKQIYDRVMNTPAKGGNATAPPNTTPTPPPPAPPVADAPKPPSVNPSIQPQPPIESPPSEPFLTSAPPRPLQGPVGVRSFAMGKEQKSESKPAAAATGVEKKGMSKALIIILIGVFFAAWSFFWVVFFFNPFA